MRGGTTAEFKSRLPLKGLADQLNLYVCEVLYGEHTKGELPEENAGSNPATDTRRGYALDQHTIGRRNRLLRT